MLAHAISSTVDEIASRSCNADEYSRRACVMPPAPLLSGILALAMRACRSLETLAPARVRSQSCSTAVTRACACGAAVAGPSRPRR